MGTLQARYWSGLPCPPPGDLPNPGIEPRSAVLQADSLLTEPAAEPLLLDHLGLPLRNSLPSHSWLPSSWDMNAGSSRSLLAPHSLYPYGQCLLYHLLTPSVLFLLPNMRIPSWYLRCKRGFFLHSPLAKKVILNAQLGLSLGIRAEFRVIPWTTMGVTIRLWPWVQSKEGEIKPTWIPVNTLVLPPRQKAFCFWTCSLLPPGLFKGSSVSLNSHSSSISTQLWLPYLQLAPKDLI